MSKYRIHVGRKREGSNAVAGFLEKDGHGNVRNDIIKGTPVPVSIQVGTFGVPNGTQAWGIRLDKNRKKPENPLRVDDENYRGEITWLPWGHKDGTMIRARYIAGYQTIDKDYQDSRLQIKVTEGFMEGGESIALLTFQHGYNEYDTDTNKSLVDMLKIHHHNTSSVSKNPELDGEMFYEVTEADTSDQTTKLIETKGECLLLVSASANKPESVRNLFEIVKDVVKAEKVNRDDAGELYKWLGLYADQDPIGFANKINQYKTNVSSVLEKAKSYKVLDLTTDGFIAAGEKNKEVVLKDIPEKGEKMLDWAFAHCLEPEVYDAVIKIQLITDKLK